MENELNNQSIEAVKKICRKHSIDLNQISIECIDDFVEIKIFHPVNLERYVSISTQNDEVLVGIEFNHLHFPEFSDQDNIPDLIASLTDILDKYLSGSISSFAASSNSKRIVGGHRTSPIDKYDIKKSFKHVKKIEVYNWNNPEIEIIFI